MPFDNSKRDQIFITVSKEPTYCKNVTYSYYPDENKSIENFVDTYCYKRVQNKYVSF